MKDYLFVYGTLKKDLAPPEIAVALKKLKYVGSGFIYGRMYDLGKYPGAIVNRGIRDKVFGRIYELPSGVDSPLSELDDYEEFYPDKLGKSLFVRKKVNVHRPGRQALKSWAYIYNKGVKPSQMIESGSYSRLAA